MNTAGEGDAVDSDPLKLGLGDSDGDGNGVGVGVDIESVAKAVSDYGRMNHG